MRSVKPALAAVIVSAIVALGTGIAAPQESLDGEQSYVLTFDDGADVDSVLVELERSFAVTVTHRFGTVVPGVVVTTSEVPEAMDSLPGVATVDRNDVIQLDPIEPSDPDDPALPEVETPEPTVPDVEEPEPTIPDVEEPEPTVPEEPKAPVPWGLDRIDQRALPLSGEYEAAADGAGVTVYVVDSGISPHDQFGDRLKAGVDFVNDGNGTSDCYGHGTHVAGTVAGRTVGVAPGATVVPVRFLDCDGSAYPSLAVAAFDWIAATHPAGQPGVVNVSAGGLRVEAVERAVGKLIARGLTVVAAAGNENASACGLSLGNNVAGAIVTGASDPNDARAAEFSNYGPCVELFAPGTDIESASSTSNSGLKPESGTSMAAPHVAGAAAVLLSLDPWRTGPEVEQALVADATPGVVGNAGDGSPNLLLFSDPARVASAPSGALAPPPPPEVAPAIEVNVTVLEIPIRAAQTAVLAFTGGDPRAMLAMSILLILCGIAVLAISRRRERFATMPLMRAGESPADPFLQVRPRQRR